MTRARVTMDGNEAAARVAYRLSEVVAIYPITPASPMGEWADQWSSEDNKNLWGVAPKVIEMQSEGGAAGVLHGAIQAGVLATTFTASQGLLLMIPSMYKIAGELTPTVIHVAARSLAAQALSIFGDHSDVMAVRQSGFALLCSASVQEAMDFALIAHATTLSSRLPFLHFFDGFRTSHEMATISALSDDDLRALVDNELIAAHRARALSPDHPFIRGTAQNPDVYFQAREACNPYYLAAPMLVQQAMDKLYDRVGRKYHLFDYEGAPDAERVLVLMGSGTETASETAKILAARGEKVGVLKVRLYRPFSIEHFIAALPKTVKTIAVLDRTKEPGSAGEPLYLDVVTAVSEAITAGTAPFQGYPRIVGGRYGLSSKEFTPAMVKAVFDEIAKEKPKNHFTVGILDDVTHTSLDYDPSYSIEDPHTVRAIFYGLGADGTVGANKNTIKILGEETDLEAQGYFVYDSKKSGSVTISHLRFGQKPILAPYLIERAGFVACHQFGFLERLDMLKVAEEGGIFLVNSPYGREEVWNRLTRTTQRRIIDKKLRLFVIDAASVAKESGMGGRINTIMQTCFFALSGVLPREEAILAIKRSIKKTYERRGEAVVEKNYAAVDAALSHLYEVSIPAEVSSGFDLKAPVPAGAPDFVKNVTAKIIAGEGDLLPVSAMPVDGTFPSGTARWEKRDLSTQIPVWDEQICIQCGKCVLICPHAVIRAKVITKDEIAEAPDGFLTAKARWREFSDKLYTLQIAPEDCTGCSLCVEICPAKSKTEVRHKALNMNAKSPIAEKQGVMWDFFVNMPQTERQDLSFGQVKDIQLLEPLFEFSGACAGCGETPYLKLMTQLFGDHALVANATGCSSIYGGNLPTTPWTMNGEGRGPAWANSLFEDNAEFGLGMRISLDAQENYARHLVKQLSTLIGDELVEGILKADQSNEAGLLAQRARVEALNKRIGNEEGLLVKDLRAVANALVKKSVWIVGGDGWAYDIGYGGLDHVLASGANINILVLDTEVYSNTGGQQSKSTPRAAVAKFAAGGKGVPKKDLAMMAMTYGHVYVARVAMGAGDQHTLKTFIEAESFQGPSLIIAYSHCIAHGYDLIHGLDQQKAAVATGYWPLFRYDPRKLEEGKNPLEIDSKPPSLPLEKYIYNEGRYSMLVHRDPKEAKRLLELARSDVNERYHLYERWAQMLAPDAPKEK